MTPSNGIDRAQRSSNRSGSDALRGLAQFSGGVNDTDIDLVDGRAVGMLQHYGPAGTGYWLWRALSSSEQQLLNDVDVEQLADDLSLPALRSDDPA